MVIKDIAGLEFVQELDKLKSVLRQTLLYDKARRENTAEHSWHLATSVLILARHSNAPLNLERAVKMALIHDIVEIDAGDTFVYDEKGYSDKEVREKKAATRLFGMLPHDLGTELRSLWDAFEAQKCADSKFVAAIDRLLPVMANFKTQGHAWKTHKIKKSQVLNRNKTIAHGSEKLWSFAQELIEECARQGYLLAE